jgi:hypothetical protein
MSELLEFVGITAADGAVEKSNNEIKFDNFITQGKDNNILTLKENCTITEPSLFGNKSFTMNNEYLFAIYMDLYDYLITKGIIIKQVKKASLWTWDNVHTINPNLIDESNLKKLINVNDKEFPNMLKCHTIDYKKLSNLLGSYKYKITDQVMIAKGGKKRKTKILKNSKKKTLKHKKNKIRNSLIKI